MDGQGIANIILAVLGPTGLAGIITILRSRRRPAVDRKDADAAVVQDEQQDTTALAHGAMDLAARMEKRLVETERKNLRLEKRADHQDTEIGQLREEVGQLRQFAEEARRTIGALRRALARIRDWWQAEVVDDWETVRARPHPPDFPTTNEED